jgi:hypothetical protein
MLGACATVIGVGALLACLAPAVGLHYSCWRYRRALDASRRLAPAWNEKSILQAAAERLANSGATFEATRRTLGEPACVSLEGNGILTAYYPHPCEGSDPLAALWWGDVEQGYALTFKHGRLRSAESTCDFNVFNDNELLWYSGAWGGTARFFRPPGN